MHDQCITRLLQSIPYNGGGLGPPTARRWADAFGLCRPQHDWLKIIQLNTVFRGACGYELVFSGPSWSALEKPYWLDVGNYFLSLVSNQDRRV